MNTLSELLMGLTAPIVMRAAGALGIGTIAYTGASSVLDTLTSAAKAAWSGLGADVLSLLAMAGVFESMAITMGGLGGAIAMMAFKRLGLITGTTAS